MLQSSLRSAAILILAAGLATTSATAKPPGAPPGAPGAHPAPGPRAAPAPHPAAAQRPAPPPRAAAPHVAAPRVVPQAPKAVAPKVTSAPRAAPQAHRAAPQQLARPSGGGARRAAGQKERTVVTPAQERRQLEGRSGPGLAQPTLRDHGTPTPRGRAAAGSVRPCGAGKSAWPGVATAQHQQGGGGSRLAQRGLCQQTRQRRAQCARAGTIDIPRAVLRSRMAAASVAADRHRLARTHVLAVCVR